MLSRVVLLSDGCANHGVCDVTEIERHCAQLASAGVTTSTYGLGQNFNEQLMVQMARAGRGNSYYGQTAQDLMEPFMQELDLLAALCARTVQLRLVVPDGVRATVLNDYAPTANGGVRLPDLASGGEAWALGQLTIPARALDAIGKGTPLLQAIVSMDGMDGQPLEVETATLGVPVLSAEAVGALPVNALVATRAIEVEAASIQKRAADAASAGDWTSVERELARARLLAAEHPWVAEIVALLESLAAQREAMLFAKEARYSARVMDSRLAAPAESAQWSADAGPSYRLGPRAARPSGRGSRIALRRHHQGAAAGRAPES